MRRLGIDTSNYTTSVALAEDGRILADRRRPLSVGEGEKGLRQSDALYQHWSNLPGLIGELFEEFDPKTVDAIAVSTRPRPAEGSYMPVFNAGAAAAKMLSAALRIPVKELSHQHGHLFAGAHGTDIVPGEPLIFAHLSGGTLELVEVRDGRFTVCGGTRDISYGQLIDRCGVDMGLPFPAGPEVDRLAMSCPESGKNAFSRVFTDGAHLNLSGLETQLKKAIFAHGRDGRDVPPEEKAYICRCLMERVAESFLAICGAARKSTGVSRVLASGGVSCSKFLRERCGDVTFGDPALCADNACGLALCDERWL